MSKLNIANKSMALLALFLNTPYLLASEIDGKEVGKHTPVTQVQVAKKLAKLEQILAINNAKLKQLNEVVSQPESTSVNSFNPAISLILSGQFSHYQNNPNSYQLNGFALNDEAGLATQGFTIGESELSASANIDNRFYGQMNLSISGDANATNIALEEAFIQTIGLGDGLTFKMGRFFSALGYVNEQHTHAWDFTDAPLIYRGLFGDKLSNDGLQINYILPTDNFAQVGLELSNGQKFPSSGAASGVGSLTAYSNFGGDIGYEQSWQLGLNYWQANNIKDRAATNHTFSGSNHIYALDYVHKWAPKGNPVNENFKFQFEYFKRDEKGTIDSSQTPSTFANVSYNGVQTGWYAQTIYQFKPQWKTGLRYDRINIDNTASNSTALSTSKLDSLNHQPQRFSVMLAWLPSEFSQFKLQINNDQSYSVSDTQLFLQYTFSLGSHGAHTF